MFTYRDIPDDAEVLAAKLARSEQASAGLFAEVVAASLRLGLLLSLGKTRRLERLLASEAWSDAALELLTLEAPEWSVQRLCREDGEWLCTLARFRDLPDWLDDCVEASHRALPLAILGAVLELRSRRPANVPHASPGQNGVVADCADYR